LTEAERTVGRRAIADAARGFDPDDHGFVQEQLNIWDSAVDAGKMDMLAFIGCGGVEKLRQTHLREAQDIPTSEDLRQGYAIE